VAKKPSWGTVIVTGWVGFMFATAVAALIPSLQLLVAPILCHGSYGHGVVQAHDYSYGTTSGYTTSLRCANAAHQETGTNGIAVIGLLWLYGWVAALLIRGVYYWGKFLIGKGLEEISYRRSPPPSVRPRAGTATPAMLLGASSSQGASAPKVGSPPWKNAPSFAERMRAANARTAGGRQPDPVDQLMRLADLHSQGALTDAEFAAEKSRIIGI
jgi:hypothetical protein